MKNSKNLARCLVLAGGMAAGLLCAVASADIIVPVTVQNTPKVTVTNTAANPVPVTGSITATLPGTVNANITNASVPVNGTVNATITNTTAVPVSGSVNANITNSPSVTVSSLPSVTVGNTSANPIPVTVSSTAAQTPVTGYCTALTTPNGSAKEGKCQLFNVPTGQRLVVEILTYSLLCNDADVLLFGPDNGPGSTESFGANVVPIVPIGKASATVFNPLTNPAGSVTTRMYIDEGVSLVGYGVSYIGNLCSSPQLFGFSGYLVAK